MNGKLEIEIGPFELVDIESRYSEPHRFYHTIAHIMKCMIYFKMIEDELDFPKEVQTALWYHDAIYNPERVDNEEQSARLASVHLNGAGFDLDLIMKLILTTKHPSRPQTNDEKYMVDIDLAILGAPQEGYLKYSKDIRKEYSHISDKQYRHGRKKAIKEFLRLPFIYHTEHFRKSLEDKARLNIESEISNL